jgi:uncharacterized protein YggE
MKKHLIPTIVSLLAVPALIAVPLVTTPVQTEALAEDENFCISIIGKAQTEVSPDYADVTLTIENLDSDVSSAKDKTFAIFDKAVESLTGNGVLRENIIVEGYSSHPNYDYTCGKSLIGYYSNLTFTYKTDDIAQIKTTIDGVTEVGVTNVQSIKYGISNEEELYNTTLSNAIENAKAKAKKVFGHDSIQIIGLEEESVYYSSSLYRYYDSSLESQDMVGKVTIQARARVKFATL